MTGKRAQHVMCAEIRHNRKFKMKILEMFPRKNENTGKPRQTNGSIYLIIFDDTEILQRAICEFEQVVFREFGQG